MGLLTANVTLRCNGTTAPTMFTSEPSSTPTMEPVIPTIQPTKNPTTDGCLGDALTCNEILRSTQSWGVTTNAIDFTRVGYATLGSYTLVLLTTQSFSGITCNSFFNGITLQSSSTMRALMGNYTSRFQFPTFNSGCASRFNPNGVHNSPADQASAQQICRQLGYNRGTVSVVRTNTCPEPHYNITSEKWESDFINSPEWGRIFTCLDPCPRRYILFQIY